ncbi:DUF4468 domain-containing protein [Hymenobacter sp. H14-R3]|uniref:DUF4468 domain-containing protein n=1 Tax=Hymenobacter sp. H14-R3 TaxID=3046308 RepID=UPI0024B9679B|nr:DUF4468 domain-containing protein [Hymenobacter sp. H14-R3]MDJ0367224.1 DUF4468 domain-containing protein [Hymenobacter sp. H14-R3]
MRASLCLLATGFLLALGAHGQALPTDERGRVAFYEVVPADSLRAGLLYAHAKAWLHRRGYVLAAADSLGGRLVATNAFGVYDRGYVTKKLHGKVAYELTVEVKNGRYRQQFTDFVFAYYHEDRTYHTVPTGKTKSLEEPTAAGWQKLWDGHRQATRQAVQGFAAELKTAMLAVPKPLAQQPRKLADW